MSDTRPAGWLNYEDFAAGIATNRLPRSKALAGTELQCNLPGEAMKLRFVDPVTVEWSDARGQGKDWYEAIQVADTTWFVDMTFQARPAEALTLIFDTQTLRLLAVRCRVQDEPAAKAKVEPRVPQDFLVGAIGSNPAAATGAVPAETRDLIGGRALFTYSPEHAYEHIYLSSARFCWQCLVGAQRGHAYAELATTIKFAENQYIFTWREAIIPVSSVFFFNFAQMRSTGKFLGLTKDGAIENNPAGAYIQKLSTTCYPANIQPV